MSKFELSLARGMGTNLGKEKRAMFGGDGSLVR